MLEHQSVLRDAGDGLPVTVTAPLLAHPPSPAEPSRVTGGSPEITNEEIDAASAACCRICLESETEPGDELISPCMCKGTHQFVHRSCLDHWRSVKEGTAFSHCTTCKAQFHLRVEFLEDDICRRMKFRLFVARDVFIIFFVIQAAIAAIGGLAYLLDKDGNFRNRFSDDWEQFLSKHPVPFYYCVATTIHAWLDAVIVAMGGVSLTYQLQWKLVLLSPSSLLLFSPSLELHMASLLQLWPSRGSGNGTITYLQRRS